MDTRSIGMFDSGIGGLTVLKEVKRLLPNEEIIYLGDTKRFPYGSKSRESIIEASRNCIKYLTDRLVKRDISIVNRLPLFGDQRSLKCTKTALPRRSSHPQHPYIFREKPKRIFTIFSLLISHSTQTKTAIMHTVVCTIAVLSRFLRIN